MNRWLVCLLAGFCAPIQAHVHMHHPSSSSAAKPWGVRTAPAQGITVQGVATAWSALPMLLPERPVRGERSQVRLRLSGIDAPELAVYAPEGPAPRRKMFPVVGGVARIASVAPTRGNYHWVLAREERTDEVRVATTAWYFSNPGASPRAMLQAYKHELEIIPEPLPREHSGYRESETWRFLVRFRGQPLASKPLLLETEHGSRITFHTDAHGYAAVLFPRDFRPAIAPAHGGGHDRRRAGFVLAVRHEAEGRRYLTAFNHFYGEDWQRSRSLVWGTGFLLAGMALGVPLLRRGRSAQQREAPHA